MAGVLASLPSGTNTSSTLSQINGKVLIGRRVVTLLGDGNRTKRLRDVGLFQAGVW